MFEGLGISGDILEITAQYLEREFFAIDFGTGAHSHFAEERDGWTPTLNGMLAAADFHSESHDLNDSRIPADGEAGR